MVQDRIKISIYSDEDKNWTRLIVARKCGRGNIIINELYDEEAKQVYKQLTGKSI